MIVHIMKSAVRRKSFRWNLFRCEMELKNQRGGLTRRPICKFGHDALGSQLAGVEEHNMPFRVLKVIGQSHTSRR